MVRHLTAVLALMVIVTAAASARSETTLSVEAGWGGRVRAHRWTPIFVTASDSKPRNVILEVRWPHGGNYAMQVHQAFTIGPTPATFPLLLPVHGYGYSYQEAVYVLSDAVTHKSLARFPEPPGSGILNAQAMLEPAGSLVGVSGRRTFLQSLQGTTQDQLLSIAYVPPSRLPLAAIGYDALDLLVLNQPNLSGAGGGADTPIDPVQQQAIVDWVRAGGNLLLWPGDNGLPSIGPLLEILPAKSASRISLQLEKSDLSNAGLPARYAQLPAYRFDPEPGAQQIELFHGKAAGYSKARGLGRIVMLPIDVAGLQFDSTAQGKSFWNPLVQGMRLTLAEPATRESTQQNFPGYQISNDDQKQTDASFRIADKLGDVPGAGSFGFFYVAVALVLMMVVVGPLDWIVLKRLGRQPWTWVTTTGWIGLITFAAISVGYLLKSGDLHYRTIRYVYQVGDGTVASNDMIGIYSPRSRDYTFGADATSWWQPAAVSDYGSPEMAFDIDFHQTYQGNLPEAQRINVWSLRFLRADHVESGPPMLAASLREENGSVVGTIQNLSDRPLTNIRVRTAAGIGLCKLFGSPPTTRSATQPAGEEGVIGRIPPFSGARVEAVLKPDVTQAQPAQPQFYYGQQQAVAPADAEMWQVASQLEIKRTTQMEQRVAGNWACVYAEMVNPPAAVGLNDHPEALQRHWQFIQALIELKPSDQRP